MAIGKRQLSRSIKYLDKIKEDTITYVPATLGLAIGGSKKVEIPTRPGFVYARIRGNLSEVVQAYNDTVANVYDLPVLIGRDKVDKTKWYVIGRDLGKYSDWGTSAYLPNHHEQHEFDPNYAGQDIVWIHNRQFLPHLVYPSGTAILVYPHAYFSNDAWSYSGVQMISNVLDYKPTGSNARVVLVYMDGDDDALLLPGSYFNASLTGTADVIDNLPVLPTTTADPIAAVRLLSGTSTIAWNNLYDLRQFHSRGSGGSLSTGSNGHIIQDEGTPLINRNNLNFVGTNVWAVDDSGNNATKVIISGSAGGGATTLNELTDVNVPTPASGTSLTYNGSEWIAVQITGSSGGGSVTWDGSYWTSLAKPNSPSAYDDEFDDSNFNTGTAWTYLPYSYLPDVQELEWGIRIRNADQYQSCGFYRDTPGGKYSAFTKLHIMQGKDSTASDYAGILVCDTVTNEEFSGVILGVYLVWTSGVATMSATVQNVTFNPADGELFDVGFCTLNGECLLSSPVLIGCHTDIYLKVIVDGVIVELYYSQDGIAYHYIGLYDIDSGMGITADNIGLIAVGTDGSEKVSATFNYFRISTTVDDDREKEIPSGNRIYYKLK